MSARSWLALPVLLVAAVVAMILWWRPLDELASGAPPVEEAVVESVRLSPGLISITLRTDGSAPVVVSQVQVDGAYRNFTAEPERPTARFGIARFDIPYPWIAGEAHHIALVTQTGAVIEHSIEVAQATPVLDGSSLVQLATVGVLLGAVPVAIGLLAWPAMRGLGRRGIHFLLALTAGLLLFLLIDSLGEGLEEAGETIGRLRGPVLFWVVAGMTTISLLALGRRGGVAPEGLKLSWFIALGIGLHNFGEGLAVGAALATGAAALATYLVIGFTIHNVTEGIGIAAPAAEVRPKLIEFIGLAALAGLPAVAGTVLGTQAMGPFWISICFAIAAGAILQVIIEVIAVMTRRAGLANLLDPAVVGGGAAGLMAMYATALLV